MAGDARALECREVEGGRRPGRAQQDGNVAGLEGPPHAVVLDRLPAPQQLRDAVRQERRLHRRLVRVPLRLAAGGVLADAVQLHHGTVRRGVREPGTQCLGLAVAQLAGPLGHRPSKDVVDRREDLGPGAEVLREENFPGLPRLRRLVGRKVPVLPEENARVRQAEAVDGLLDIAHEEEVPLLPGHGPEDGVLNGVAVLVLVH